MSKILDQLSRPFPESCIRWRVGATNGDKTKGIALAYIDARDAYQRFDDLLGLDWQCEYPFEGCCKIGIFDKETDTWIWRSNGAGATDIEGVKGQYSDSFKRAAVLFGVARYLYDLPNEWVPLKARGRSYVLAEVPKLPQWATPSGWNRIESGIKREVYEQTMEALSRGDEVGLRQVWEEFDNEEKIQLWPLFDSKERAAIKALNK